jgi:Domain of unknown function (DUF4062)/Tetratricopeptide repeat
VGWVMIKVYVSSTVADLRQERQAVIDWLVAAQHLPVHSYRPSSDTVQDSCLDDVDTCDLYVLILGDRYGFQPEEGNPEGLSITHLEFRRAGESGVPRIALLRAGGPGTGLSGGEAPQRAASLAGFRAEVAREVRAGEFSDMQGLIQGLSTGVQAELDKLFPAGRVLRLAPQPLFLVGREGLLADLDGRLGAGDGGGPRAVVLHGLAGAGKTSVALEYAHRHQAEAGVIWQLPAEDPTVLAARFAELAAALAPGKRVGDPVVAVHGALATYRGRWLLLFDNAPDRPAVQRFLPPVGRGRVLITTRNALWPSRQLVEVPVLDVAVAAGFLMDRTGDPGDQAAEELATELGGLPLALEQAAAYIQATGDTLARYLADFHTRRADLLARGDPDGYPGTVAATWALAFTQLEQAAPAAAGLLRLLAFCAPEAVPLGLLLQPHPRLTKGLRRQVAKVLKPLLEDPLAVTAAIAALRRYSLISTATGGSVSVHRLVQAVTADQMPGKLAEAWKQAAGTVIEAAIPADPDQPDSWPTFAALLPHAQTALTAQSHGMTQIGFYLGYSGNYVAARELWGRMLEEQVRNFGAEHPDTLTTRANLASLTGQAGDAAGARDQYAAVLPIVERVSGAEHPGTLTIRSNLALWTGAAGDAAGARHQYAVLLRTSERVLGPEHPGTLTIRSNLATSTGHAGDAAGARDQFAALLPIVERVSGAGHPGTLLTRSNLAQWTGAAGDAAGARDEYAALLPIYQQLLGPEHPDILTTRNNLAHWTGAAGDAPRARDQYAALLPIYQRVQGPEHPDTLTARANLATYTGVAGDAPGARDQYAELLPVVERVQGPSTRTPWPPVPASLAGPRRRAITSILAWTSYRHFFGPSRPTALTCPAHVTPGLGLLDRKPLTGDQPSATETEPADL